MKNIKVIVSCSGKFHAFSLSEQVHKHQMLSGLWTSYAFQKNTWVRSLTKRVDREDIPIEKIHTCLPIAFGIKIIYNPYLWNELFDLWVAEQLKIHQDEFDVFIGWSGMSLHSIRQANKMGKITIVERGSSHIRFQDNILHEEYKKFGINFHIDPRVVKKEEAEYFEANYVSIPSTFVKNSFLEYGVSEHKLLQTAYGTSNSFQVDPNAQSFSIFTVLYVGTLSIQKGLVYLFEALEKLKEDLIFNVIFVGHVDTDFQKTVDLYQAKFRDWEFLGHINHYELPELIQKCHVAIQPSLQEGLSMVIPQILSCGVPVIATTNTGGEDIIENGKTGFIVPIRSSNSIAYYIKHLIENPEVLSEFKKNIASKSNSYSWDRYGNEYIDKLKSLPEVNSFYD